jgi:hypothetical protein
MQKNRAKLLLRSRITKIQHAYPDAPKPIHPDKEHCCPSTIKLGANLQSSRPPTFAGAAQAKH